MNCGGARGQRTEFWRSLSYHLGDFLADEVCRWVDRTEDGGQTIAAVESTARLGGGRALREYLGSRKDFDGHVLAQTWPIDLQGVKRPW
jgi:hypothetical protein